MILKSVYNFSNTFQNHYETHSKSVFYNVFTQNIFNENIFFINIFNENIFFINIFRKITYQIFF